MSLFVTDVHLSSDGPTVAAAGAKSELSPPSLMTVSSTNESMLSESTMRKVIPRWNPGSPRCIYAENRKQ